MNFDNDKWNIADEEFSQWLNGNEQVSNLDLTDILKSTYLTFREKQRSWLEELCKRSLDHLDEKQNSIQFSLREPGIMFKKGKPKVDDTLLDNVPNFRRKNSPLFGFGNLKKIVKGKNDKIINGILTGDQQIFNELYEDEFPKVVRLVTKNSGNQESAKDVFQDGLLILMEKIYHKKLNLECAIETYLYSICRILWMEHLRNYKKDIILNDLYNHLQIDITIDSDENEPDVLENVYKAIESLGDPCKQLLECFYYKKLSWTEIASSLGYSSPASARNQKYKCLERIRSTVYHVIE